MPQGKTAVKDGVQVIQGTPIPDPEDPATEMIRVMPPTSPLKPNVVDVFARWIMAGMPQTPDEAAALSITATPDAADVATQTP